MRGQSCEFDEIGKVLDGEGEESALLEVVGEGVSLVHGEVEVDHWEDWS